MRLEWLEDILAIAETGSFSGAAERRRLTQSAFSRRVQQIETYVGVELFDRDHKPIRLRHTTMLQSDQIAQLANALRQLAVDLRRGERLTSNKLVVACQHSLTTVRMPAIIHGLQKAPHEIYVRVRSANLEECTGLLLSRQADVAIVYLLPGETEAFSADYLEAVTIGTDQLIPVFRTALPTLLSSLSPATDIPFITYPAEVFFGKVMERHVLPFLDQALNYIPRVETALTLAAVEMAMEGIGIAWVPKSLAQRRIATGQLVDLSADLPKCALAIMAIRLQGSTRPAEDEFWVRLLEQ